MSEPQATATHKNQREALPREARDLAADLRFHAGHYQRAATLLERMADEIADTDQERQDSGSLTLASPAELNPEQL